MRSRQSPASALIVVAVIIGLISVPVECAVADGPHSIFIEATMLAAMQHGNAAAPQPAGHDHGRPQHHHGAAVAESSVPLPQSAHASPPASDDRDERSGAKLTMPKPAGLAGDAIVAITTPAAVSALPGDGVWQRIGTDRAVPRGRLLRGPEPPPPLALIAFAA